MDPKEFHYTLTRERTRQQTGRFVVVPDKHPPLDEALAFLTVRPMDDFLHQYVLRLIGSMAPEELQRFLDRCEADHHLIGLALIAEYQFLAQGRDRLGKRFSENLIRELTRYTPLIYLRACLEPDQPLHARWAAIFRANLHQHTPLPPPDPRSLPPLAFETVPCQPVVAIEALSGCGPLTRQPTAAPRVFEPGRTADIAEERLHQAGIALGQLMRHESSLSPVGLLRAWQVTARINSRRNRFLFSGEQTSYGRGLTLDAARASLMMEIVERCSAFVSVSQNGLENFQKHYPIRCESFSELAKNRSGSEEALNPSDLALEVPYQNQPVHWVLGETPGMDPHHRICGSRPAWLPVQCLFLFCNLDEPALFSGLGSTGLAAGNTPAQAKSAALLETIERHQAATVPYHLSSCFQLEAGEPRIAALLEAYRRAGIHLWFQDITPSNGIPCCRCFVVEKTGILHVGAAAHLSARKAILSAILETSCPFPHAPLTRPAPPDLTRVGYENLPDYSTNDDDADLALLESVLMQNHWRPYYLDVTRSDIGLPVFRALVPGMEILGDFDDYTRIHPELYRNYLSLFESNPAQKKGLQPQSAANP